MGRLESRCPPAWPALLAREGAKTGASAAKSERGFSFRGFDNAWPMWAAAAAAAVIGVGVPQALHVNDPVALAGGRVVASGPLARSLEHDPAAGAAGAVAKVMASFEDREGRYCRVFEAAGNGHQDGVACKSNGRWQVVALANAAGPEPSAGYRRGVFRAGAVRGRGRRSNFKRPVS